MTQKAIECPHCGGGYFNYSERRTTERVGLAVENGALKMRGGGIPKDLVVVAECRGCGGEHDAYDLAEFAAEEC